MSVELSPERHHAPAARAFYIALAALLGAHLLLVLAHAGTFMPDDADLVIFSQSLAWGYHEQPPLYPWLTWLFFHVFGLNFFAFGLLKTLVLGAIYVPLFATARLLLVDERHAAIVAFAPLLIPTFAWHSFFYLTHTNLACAAAAATFYLVLRLAQERRWHDYLSLGVAVGVGTLAKYNYLLFASALLVAALTVPRFRSVLLQRRSLATLLIATIMVAPNVAWLLANRDALLHILALKTAVNAQTPWAGRATGARNLLTNVFLILLPVGLAWAAFRRGRAPGVRDSQLEINDSLRLLRRFFFVIGIFLLLMVIAGATRLHERWLQPFTLLAPLYVFAAAGSRTVPILYWRRLAYVLAASAVLCIAIRTGQLFTGRYERGQYPLHMDFSAVRNALGPAARSGAVFIVGEREICGNLRYQLQAGRYVCAEHPLYAPPPESGERAHIVVWNATEHEAPPPQLMTFAEKTLHRTVLAEGPPQFLDVPAELPGGRTNRLGYFFIAR